MPRSLFDRVAPEETTNRRYRQVRDHRVYAAARRVMDEVFANFPDVDHNFIQEFQTGGFSHRVLELALFAYLQEQGYDLDRSAPAPADAEAYKRESFDLVLHRDGKVKHVEVKGTTQTTGFPDSGIQVFLTLNEVAHARGECKAVVTCHSVALFVLTDVVITPDKDGTPTAIGGTPLVYDPWNLTEEALKATAYSYNVLRQ